MSCHYECFLGNHSLGVGTVEPGLYHGEILPPEAVAFCCPYCGDVWARCVPYGGEPKWHFYASPCELHGQGSLWLAWNKEHNRALPVAALEREFLAAAANCTAWSMGGWLDIQGNSEPEFNGSDLDDIPI